ncbi:MAG: PD40 domain-containing protein [Verrucomicrobia bacterium]|nr:PD40 domain-containing protein [Verrucomicrobiota bacterium]
MRFLPQLASPRQPRLRLRPLFLLGLGLPVATVALARTPIRMAQDPALSPDGKTLVFSWFGDLWSVPSTGGTARPLTRHPGRDTSPSFSPDGTQIAFLSDREAGPQIFLLPAAGGVPQRLTSHTEGYVLDGWYPDGSALLVNADRDFSYYLRSGQRFFRVPVKAPVGEHLVFDDYGRTGDLSPDGKRLLFTREGEQATRKGYRGSQASQIWLYDSVTGIFTKLIAEDTSARFPRWRPDGKGFYFTSGRSGSVNLWEYELANARQTQLTKFADDPVTSPAVSRDGRTIVFRHLFDFYRFEPGRSREPVRLEIWDDSETAAANLERRTLTNVTDVAFSNDGLEVAFVAGGDLWVMDTILREPRQVTRTPESEHSPVFAPDGKSLIFVSDQNGQSDLWQAERENADEYWWRNDRFKLTRLTDDAETEQDLRWSPDGSLLAFIRGNGDLCTFEVATKTAKCVLPSWNRPQYDWSPDGKWLVASLYDNDFNGDIWIFRSDGTGERVNISRHPDNESNPVWSPDGRMIAFTGRRIETEVDIYYVQLRAEDDKRTKRGRTMEKAVEKMAKARKKDSPRTEKKVPVAPKTDNAAPADAPATATATTEPKEPAATPAPARTAAAGRKLPEVKIDFDRIHERVRRISIPNSTERELLWSPDSKKLAFTASVDGRRGTYTVEFPEELRPKLLCPETGTQGRWLESGNQIVWRTEISRSLAPEDLAALDAVPRGPRPTTPVAPTPATPVAPTPAPVTPATPPVAISSSGDSGGSVPASVSDSGRVTRYSFRAAHEFDPAAKHQAAFDLAWRTMRDSWYDSRLGNRNWDEVRRKYRDMAATPDAPTLAAVINLMLGELNGSHLGFTLRSSSSSESPNSWTPVTAHLGLRWDRTHRGPGLKVRDVIPDGPADRPPNGIAAGETVVAIDGTAVDAETDLARLLSGPSGRDVKLRVANAEGQERDVVIEAARYSAIRSLLYPKWIRDNRALVEARSGGKLGYLHIRAMDQESFQKFEQDLYAAGVGRDGLIIDVRDNGGGSTADHLLTALTQPVHAIAVPRGGGPGYPQDRKVYATWAKPIVVLCNQNSFSNAEIFSHAVKTLGRGQLVGVPTAGGVVSTGSRQIMDVGMLRLPARGWFLRDTGEDMELNGAVPHHLLWPEPGQSAKGQEVQLEKAIEVLTQEVADTARRPQPTLRKATERPAPTTPAKR